MEQHETISERLRSLSDAGMALSIVQQTVQTVPMTPAQAWNLWGALIAWLQEAVGEEGV